MTEFMAFVVGAGVGALLTRMGLPLPAPVELAGVFAIIGLWVGYAIVSRLM